MPALQEFILSGRVVDVMVVFIVLEIIAITLIRQRRGAGIAPWPLIVNIGAGASLMLALRFSLVGQSWAAITVCLLAALVFHVADLAMRWEAPPTSAAGRD